MSLWRPPGENHVSRCLMLYAEIESLDGEVFGVPNFTLLGMLSS
jgi:hypothetical protein